MNIVILILVALVGISAPAGADTSTDYAAAKEAIWAKELAIYDAWGKTGLDYYIEHSSGRHARRRIA
jgi:hypothetical protein